MSDHYIDGSWRDGNGDRFVRASPVTGQTCWEGHAAGARDIEDAIAAARRATAAWADTPLPNRIALLDRFADALRAARDELAQAISIETGKPRWESLGEVDTMIGKIPATLDALHTRRSDQVDTHDDLTTATRYRPHGVLVVLGPFNLPGHLPNGHIVPALLAGNTVVFKPSEHAPGTACRMLRCWHEAQLPAGVINLVQGGRDIGKALVEHAGHDGVLFTGSYHAGVAIARTLVDEPGRIVALELGGNNPLVVHDAADRRAAVLLTLQSAFITAGQRCTCARRLILPRGRDSDAFLEELITATTKLRIGRWDDDPPPFMGPLIHPDSARHVLDAQARLVKQGATMLLPARSLPMGDAYLSPGIIDVTSIAQPDDEEVFGPLLQVIHAHDFDHAIALCNRTRYGLVAGLISDRAELYKRFRNRVRSGLINFNRPTTGASGRLAFGGVGRSGNHRPSGFFAIDYCNHPVASLEQATLKTPDTLPPGLSA